MGGLGSLMTGRRPSARARDRDSSIATMKELHREWSLVVRAIVEHRFAGSNS
jgi:hypothetical protein